MTAVVLDTDIGQLTWTREAAARLTAHAARCGGVAGGHFVIFHGMVTADSDGPVEVCVRSGIHPRTRPSWPGGSSPRTGKPLSR